MSGFKRFEFLDSPFSFLYRETFLCSPTTPFYPPFAAAITEEEAEHQIGFALDLLNPSPSPLDLSLQCLPSAAISSFDLFDTAADLINFRRFQERAQMELQLRSLCDRVTALEVGLGRALGSSSKLDRKYTWPSEIKGAKEEGVDRKYKRVAEAKGRAERNLKWTVEFKGQKEDGFDWKYKWTTEKKGEADRNAKWTAEIEGKGKHAPVAHKYTFHAAAKPAAEEEEEKKGKKKEKEAPSKPAAEENQEKKKEKEAPAPRAVEIEEKSPGAIAIRKAFAMNSIKGKKKELSPQDAALIIQTAYRAHLSQHSQVLRCLRDLAVAKGKLKEISTLFYNFSFRHHVANDAEERQRFSEKIIVLLLTVEAIEGPDYMVRGAKKSMVEELEAMLEVVDPQPLGKLASFKRRKFDLPDRGAIPTELISGVEGVVKVLEQELKESNA